MFLSQRQNRELGETFLLNMHQKLLLRHLFLLFLDICRVCRCEGAPDRPLFHPCICTGSIKFIHQECLLQWLRYSKKEFCELCTHRFSFTPSKNNLIKSALSIIEKYLKNPCTCNVRTFNEFLSFQSIRQICQNDCLSQ